MKIFALNVNKAFVLYVIVQTQEMGSTVAFGTSGRPDLRQVITGTAELSVVQLRSSNVLDPQVE